MRLIIFILIASLLSSCKLSERKAKRQLVAIEANYSYLFANPCARLYPITEKRVKEIEYLPGKTDTIRGEPVYVNCADSANKGKKVKADCPPSTHRVDTSKITESIEKESTARFDTLNQAFERAKSNWAVLEKGYITILASKDARISQQDEAIAKCKARDKKILVASGFILAVVAVIAVLRFGWFGKIWKLIKMIF